MEERCEDAKELSDYGINQEFIKQVQVSRFEVNVESIPLSHHKFVNSLDIAKASAWLFVIHEPIK